MGEPGQDFKIRFGVFELDTRSGELRKAGIRLKLQDQPLKVLLALLERPGEVVTREELKRLIGSEDSFGDFDHAVNVAVAKLRTALGDAADIPRFVETLPRRGYRFIYPVTAQSGAESSAAVTPISITSGQLPGAMEPVALAARGSLGLRRWKLLSIAIALAGAAGVGIRVYHRYGGSFSQIPTLPDLQIAKVTKSGDVMHMDISPDGLYLAYALRSDKGAGLWVRQVGTSSDIQILPPDPGIVRGITFTPDGNYILLVRGNNDLLSDHNLYSMPVLGGPRQLLIRNVDSRCSFSPDGRQIMFVRKDVKHNTAEVTLANADGSSERLLATFAEAGGEWQAGGSWSPDGRMVAVSIGHWGKQEGWELDTISVADGSVHSFYSNADGIGPPVWLNDGKAMLVVLDDKVGRGRIWEISYPQGQAHPVTHDLEDYDVSLGATRDAKTIAAISVTETANLYVAQTADLSRLHQITFGDQLIDYVATGPNGRLLIHSAENSDGELWAMNSDGSQTALFTKLRNVGFPSRCGSFVLFVAREKEAEELIRVDADGLNPKKLASGNVWSPSCSPDGQFIFYADLSTRPQRILRISVDGGQSTEIAKVPGKWMVGSLSLSQNGKMLAYPFQQDQPDSSSTQVSSVLLVIPAEGGTPIKTFPNVLGYVQWAPGGGGLDYYDLRDGVVQIVEQPLAGGPLRQLTKFSGGQSGGFQWSLDGKQLYVTHGELKSNVVLITHFR